MGVHWRLATFRAVAPDRPNLYEVENRISRRAAGAARLCREGRCARVARAVRVRVGPHRRAHDLRQSTLEKRSATDDSDGARARIARQPRPVGEAAASMGFHRRGSEIPQDVVAMSEPAVRFEQITKRIFGVQALYGVSLEVAAGSCHALCGENGAGKSTLGKVLAGIHSPDSGKLFV